MSYSFERELPSEELSEELSETFDARPIVFESERAGVLGRGLTRPVSPSDASTPPHAADSPGVAALCFVPIRI